MAEALWQLPNSYYWPVLTWLLFLCQFTYATIPAEDWFELSPELAQIGGFMFGVFNKETGRNRVLHEHHVMYPLLMFFEMVEGRRFIYATMVLITFPNMLRHTHFDSDGIIVFYAHCCGSMFHTAIFSLCLMSAAVRLKRRHYQNLGFLRLVPGLLRRLRAGLGRIQDATPERLVLARRLVLGRRLRLRFVERS